MPELRVCALYPDLMNIYADRGNLLLLERRREIVDTAGGHTVEENRIRLERLTCEQLEQEARAAGFRPLGRDAIPETFEYTGSEVVYLGV